MTSYVDNESRIIFSFSPDEIVDRVLRTVMEIEKCPYDATVNLLMTDNERIRVFNRDYRSTDKETDVLSFPNMEFKIPSSFYLAEGKTACFDPDTGELLLGDIILSTEKVREQAECYGHSELREFAFLIVHSMLHLCGYDHIEPKDAAVMESKQTLVMKTLEIVRD